MVKMSPLQNYNRIDNNNSNNNTSMPQKQQLSVALKMFKYQNIAPAPTNVSGGCAGSAIKTRKYTPRAPSSGGGSSNGGGVGGPYSVDQTVSVQRRNARERNRVKQVNNSFARLRQHIPQTIITDMLKGGGRGPHKKISKVDTLRIAVEYIRRLQDLVDDLNGGVATQKVVATRGSGGASTNSLLMAATDNNTTSSNSSFGSSQSSSSINLSLRAAESPTQQHNSPIGAAAAAAEQLYFVSTANNVLQTAYQQPQQQMPHQSQQFTTSALLTAEALQVFTPQPQPTTQTQTQLDIGCPSPTSSFNSSMSFDSGTFVHSPAPPQPHQQQQLSPLPHIASGEQRLYGGSSLNNAHAQQIDANLQLKFEPYDSLNLHEEDCTPEDEEILDYISLWQEQQ